MQRRPLGTTGIGVSVLGLGTVKLGRNRGVKYPQPYDLPDDRAAAQLLNAARDLGINLIDTAPAYGTAEERLGKLLQGQREAWVIVTKAGEEFDPEGRDGEGVSRYDFSPEGVARSVERSLMRLRTDRIEAVLLHSNGSDLEILERSGAIGALEELKQEGKICAYGISAQTPEGALAAVECCDVVMVTCNAAATGDLPAIERARGLGVGVLVKKALRSGHGASGSNENPEDAVQEAFRFVLGSPWSAGVSSVVIGTLNPRHLAANVEAAERVLASIPGHSESEQVRDRSGR